MLAFGECFTAGTKVKTKDGGKNIEDVKAGDYVLEENPDTGEQEYKRVVRTYRGNAKDVLAAGQLKLNGKDAIKRIDNLSGHYRPTVGESMNYATLFQNLGLDLNKTWIEY